MYFEEYKADDSIFKSIPTIELGDVLLSGLLLDFLETEAKVYLLNSKDDLVKKYLPFHYVETETAALKILKEYTNRFISKAGFLFCLRKTSNKVPFGYILCNSPLVQYLDSNEPTGDWTIDFWLGQRARGHGIMAEAVYNTLIYLKQKSVPRVYAFVNKDNIQSIHVLTKCKMILVGETYDKKMFKFGIRLKSADTPL